MAQWFYQTEGQAHGPFSNDDMLSWFHQGYLQRNLPLSQDGRAFYPLQDWFPGGNNAFQQGAAADPTRNQGGSGAEQAGGGQEGTDQRWYFLDMKGEVQGPFSNGQMKDWHRDGFFDNDLQIYDTVRNPAEWGWKPLQEYFPNPNLAFGGSEEQQKREDVPVRFQFPSWLPSPPAYRGVPKVYPSERNESY